MIGVYSLGKRNRLTRGQKCNLKCFHVYELYRPALTN